MPEQEDAISIRSIDTDWVEDVEDNREAVLFRIFLNTTPTSAWVHEFDELYKAVPYLIKPPVTVVDDSIHVTYLPRYASELEEYTRFLGYIVKRANNETQITLELHEAGNVVGRKDSFRETLKKIHVPA